MVKPKTYKLITLGDPSVGKSCMLSRFVRDSFSSHHISTIGIDWSNKDIKVGDEMVNLQIWDTAGQDRFHTVTSTYYNKAQGIILIYDCTDKNTFNNISNWID